MSYQFKQVNAQVVYRLSSITLNEDGSLSTAVSVGTLSTPEGASEPTFTQIAQQGYYITKEDVEAILLDGVSGNLRQVAEIAVEAKLREKGALTI